MSHGHMHPIADRMHVSMANAFLPEMPTSASHGHTILPPPRIHAMRARMNAIACHMFPIADRVHVSMAHVHAFAHSIN